MRGTNRKGLRRCTFCVLVSGVLLTVLSACTSRNTDKIAVPDRIGATKTAASARAQRRAYDGAPPTIPHSELGAVCTECHNEQGVNVEGVGFAPPSPHETTRGMSAIVRCRQCHVPRQTDERFRPNSFAGLQQDLRHGSRQHPLAPPRMPHAVFMRENCLACHSGPAAREEIRTPHPERTRCRQCHLPIRTLEVFIRANAD